MRHVNATLFLAAVAIHQHLLRPPTPTHISLSKQTPLSTATCIHLLCRYTEPHIPHRLPLHRASDIPLTHQTRPPCRSCVCRPPCVCSHPASPPQADPHQVHQTRWGHPGQEAHAGDSAAHTADPPPCACSNNTPGTCARPVTHIKSLVCRVSAVMWCNSLASSISSSPGACMQRRTMDNSRERTVTVAAPCVYAALQLAAGWRLRLLLMMMRVVSASLLHLSGSCQTVRTQERCAWRPAQASHLDARAGTVPLHAVPFLASSSPALNQPFATSQPPGLHRICASHTYCVARLNPPPFCALISMYSSQAGPPPATALYGTRSSIPQGETSPC